jgi:hypothetical protein
MVKKKQRKNKRETKERENQKKQKTNNKITDLIANILITAINQKNRN